MPGHSGGRIAMADAICKNHAGCIIAAGEHRRKIAAFVAASGHGDDIAFQPCQVKRAMCSLITGPKLQAAEGPHGGRRAIKLFGFDLPELHVYFDAWGAFFGADFADEPGTCALTPECESTRQERRP